MYYISWWTKNTESVAEPPFKARINARYEYKPGDDAWGAPKWGMFATVDADSEAAAEALIGQYWPDYQLRACEAR